MLRNLPFSGDVDPENLITRHEYLTYCGVFYYTFVRLPKFPPRRPLSFVLRHGMIYQVLWLFFTQLKIVQNGLDENYKVSNRFKHLS